MSNTYPEKLQPVVDNDQLFIDLHEIGSEILYCLGSQYPRQPYLSEDTQERIDAVLVSHLDQQQWLDPAFQFDETFRSLSGPFIEIGGPSPGGYSFIDFGVLFESTGRRTVVTNIDREHLHSDIKESERIGTEIGGFLDGSNIPHSDESIGAFFARCLPHYAKGPVVNEIYRTLEPGGIFAYSRCGSLDVAWAIATGFEVRAYEREYHIWSDGSYDNVWEVLLQKRVEAPELPERWAY